MLAANLARVRLRSQAHARAIHTGGIGRETLWTLVAPTMMGLLTRAEACTGAPALAVFLGAGTEFGVNRSQDARRILRPRTPAG